MKKSLVYLLILGVVLSFTCNSFAQDLKIGYVDVFGVFNEYDKTKDYDATLEKKKGEIEKKLEGKKKDIEKMQSKLELLNEGEKVKEEEKIMAKVKAYRDLERSAFTDIKKARDEKMQEIVEDIRKVIKEYAKQEKFNLIISENSVLYGDDNVINITDRVLKISNQQFKKK